MSRVTYTKPLIIEEDPGGTTFDIRYGPLEHLDYRVTVASSDGTFVVDFDALGMISQAEPIWNEGEPTWQQATTAIRLALTTYLMQRNTERNAA